MADKTMVDYTQKIKPYFEGIAPIEPTTTAASAHAVGNIFYFNGELVAATSAITIGDTIVKTEGATVGNCEDADDIVTMLAGKQSTLTFDNVPTENSNNPVKSGGVYSANQNIYEVIGQNGAKNLLPFTMENIKAINTNGTWNENSYTYNGITYVVSEDGVIEVSGTNNSGTNSVFYLVITESGPQFNFKLGRYKLNGCPAGGSDPTYSWYVAKTGQYNSDFGDGVTFEVTSETDSYWSLISVKTGTALEGTKTFKPMVRLATDSDETHQPYAKTNQELTGEIKKAYQTDDAVETAIADNDYIPFYDTSATAKRKSLWSNIKAVFKAYFDTLYGAKPVIKTATLAVGSTDVTFINLPTTGDWLVSCHTSDPNVDYESVDNSTAGTLVYTFAEQESALTVYLRLEKVEV